MLAVSGGREGQEGWTRQETHFACVHLCTISLANVSMACYCKYFQTSNSKNKIEKAMRVSSMYDSITKKISLWICPILSHCSILIHSCSISYFPVCLQIPWYSQFPWPRRFHSKYIILVLTSNIHYINTKHAYDKCMVKFSIFKIPLPNTCWFLLSPHYFSKSLGTQANKYAKNKTKNSNRRPSKKPARK